MDKTQKKSVISINNTSYQLPILEPTMGPDTIDVTRLYKEAKIFTYDPGYLSTASCKSKITFINGEKGQLLHRGYTIEDLALKSDFMEVSFLLLNGELPNQTQKETFVKEITYHSMVHEQLHFLFRGFKRHSHPMAIMIGAVGTLSSFYHDSIDILDPAQRKTSAYRLIAKIPTLAAMSYKYTIGQPFIYPKNSLDYTSNFLHMMFSTPCENYEINPVISKALDKIFILHADHEQNASTSTVRLAGSSGANPFACIAAGIACLWGPAHGGANEAVINMLEEIGSTKNISKYIEKAKDKNDPFKLMGFGHRVYKNYDPRAAVLRDTCYEVLNIVKSKEENHLLDIAIKLEEIALKDEYFIDRKLFPNVDFYSGIIYKALDIPSEMYTVLFALARTVGWVSQWKEMMDDPETKIGRPRQLYIGEKPRKYIPISER